MFISGLELGGVGIGANGVRSYSKMYIHHHARYNTHNVVGSLTGSCRIHVVYKPRLKFNTPRTILIVLDLIVLGVPYLILKRPPRLQYWHEKCYWSILQALNPTAVIFPPQSLYSCKPTLLSESKPFSRIISILRPPITHDMVIIEGGQNADQTAFYICHINIQLFVARSNAKIRWASRN